MGRPWVGLDTIDANKYRFETIEHHRWREPFSPSNMTILGHKMQLANGAKTLCLNKHILLTRFFDCPGPGRPVAVIIPDEVNGLL